MKPQIPNLIPSVNFHLWQPCNMQCEFCFAGFLDVKKQFLPKGHLPKEQALDLIEMIACAGFEKITFAGGEPTLCPWLFDLIASAKSRGLTTMLVTNGSRINPSFLERFHGVLDWITLSIDSLQENTNRISGRVERGRNPLSRMDYYNLAQAIKSHSYKLKINTVVHRFNYMEDFNELISSCLPLRWKVLQVLPIEDQNGIKVEDFLIGAKEYDFFLMRHDHLKALIRIVPENNSEMTNSYVMIDPAGRFYNNKSGKHSYSEPIMKVGLESAYMSMNYSRKSFIVRGGIYRW